MRMREMKFSKNVTLKGQNIQTIQEYMFKTRKNFSATLNIIIEQWDKLSLQLIEIERAQKLKEEMDNIKNAKVLKE